MSKVRLHRYVVRIGIVAALTMTTACGGDSAGEAEKDPLVILTVTGETGLFAENAKALVRGVNAHVDEINSHGGINGREIKVISKDNQSDPTRGVTLIQESLGGEDSPHLVIPGIGSSESLAAAPLLSRNKIVSLASATQPLLDDVDEFPYFFSSSVLQDVIYDGMAEFILGHGEARKVALIVPDDAVGEAVNASFENMLADTQLEGETLRFPSDAIDVTSVFQNALSQKPDWIIMDGSGDQIAALIPSRIKAAAESVPTLLGASASSNSDILGITSESERENLFVSLQPLQAFIDPEDRGEQFNRMLQRLKEQGELTMPLTVYANGWTIVGLLKRAVETIDGEVNGDSLKRALEELPASGDPQFPLFGKHGTYSSDSHFRPGELTDFTFGKLVSTTDGMSHVE